VAETPDLLTLRRNRDQVGVLELHFRRFGVALFALFCLAGLLNVFGQRTMKDGKPDRANACPCS
jgi:hypothetical protein